MAHIADGGSNCDDQKLENLKVTGINLKPLKVKCVYKYPVKWIVKIDGIQPFTHNGWHFDFIQENQCITQIIISIKMTATDLLPSLTKSQKDDRTFDFAINEPAAAELLPKTLRTLEGFLSIYGLEKIALDEVDISWVPETEEEKQTMQEQKLTLRYSKRETSNLHAPFAVVKRSLIAAAQALDWEVPLSFYRKGNNDYQLRQYIDSIHDFYFLIETLYGNGKTKNYQVKEELRKSQTLVSYAENVLKEGAKIISNRGTRTAVLDEFKRKFANMSPEQYLDHVVDLRGFLHHHSLRHKKIWNPSLEYEYELDAILLSYLSFLICSTKVESMICTPQK